MKLIYAAALGFAVLTLGSCQKDKRDLEAAQPLELIPMHNEARLSDAVLNQVSLYYFINLTSTHKEYVADFGRAGGTGYQQGILSSADVASLSAGENIKTFYLAFPDGTTDTLSVDYQSVSDDEARQNACYCKQPQVSVRINGLPAMRAFYDKDSVPVYRVMK